MHPLLLLLAVRHIAKKRAVAPATPQRYAPIVRRPAVPAKPPVKRK